MNLFRVRGIQLALHFSFFVLLAAVAVYGWIDAGLAGMFVQTGALIAAFVCVVLHELGHCFAALHYGIGVRRILLLPIGGMAEFESMPREPRREIVIALAGPAVNFALVAVLWVLLPPAVANSTDDLTWTEFGHVMLQWNLFMGLFNLLPAFPMDGGRILRAALVSRMDYTRATFWAATTGKILCVSGLVAALWLKPELIALPVFIFFLGEMEYQAVKRRELEEEHLRNHPVRFCLINHRSLPPTPESEG